MRVLERAGREDEVAVAARPADIAGEVALPAERPPPATRCLIPARADAGVAPGRVGHLAGWRAVVVELPCPYRDEHAAGAVAPSELEIATPLGHARAGRAGKAHSKARAVLRTPGPRRDDAAKRVSAIRDRPGTAGDVDRLREAGVEKRGVRACSSLGGGAASIDENQGPAACHAANGRHGSLPFRDRAHPWYDVQRLTQGRRLPQRQVPRGEPGRSRRRGGVDVGGHTQHDDQLPEHVVDGNRQLRVGVESRDGDRRGDPAVGQHDDHHRRQGRRRRPPEAPGDVGPHRPPLPEDRDLGAGNRRAGDRVHQASVDWRCGNGQRDHGKQRQHGRQGKHAALSIPCGCGAPFVRRVAVPALLLESRQEIRMPLSRVVWNR
jgi:hypothetical protein